MANEYACDEPGCDFSTDSKRGLSIHQASHDDGSKKKEYECAECGGTFKDYPSRREGRGRENFFCDEDCKDDFARGDGLDTQCAFCGEDLYIPPSRMDSMGEYELRNHFCNKKCEARWKRQNWVSEDHPSWDGGKVEIECEVCGETRKVKPAQVEGARFCSTGCTATAWAVEEETRDCTVCGGDVTRKPYNFKGDRATCSPECFSELSHEIKLGERNPVWKGGRVAYYGPNWIEARESAFELYGEACARCGITREEHLKSEGQDLHIHHILPRELFVVDDAYDYVRGNRLQNLVPLCSAHHRVWEGIMIRPPSEEMEYSDELTSPVLDVREQSGQTQIQAFL